MSGAPREKGSAYMMNDVKLNMDKWGLKGPIVTGNREKENKIM